MAKAHIHAASSAKKFGGVADDYADIHLFLDSSKAVFPDHRHRALTHNSWFVATVLPRVFGHTRTNSAGRAYSVVDVGERHVLEDFGHRFLPTPQDYLAETEYRPWMNNGRGDPPPSHAKLAARKGGPTFEVVDADEENAVSDGTARHATLPPNFTRPQYTD